MRTLLQKGFNTKRSLHEHLNRTALSKDGTEKGDECIFVGYSTQSRAYRFFNKRTKVITESIHVNFDELPKMASAHNSSDPAPTCQTMASVQISSDLAPKCQTMALEHGSLSPGRNCQENVSHGDKTGTTSNELDLLFSLMFDELLNGSTKVVFKSSATKDHPLKQVIGNPSQSVRTRRQLESDDEMCIPESDEVIRLEKESRSKLSDLIRPFDYNKLNNLYDLFIPQREKSPEQRYFSERSRLSNTSINNGNSKESFNKQTTLLEKWMDESIPLDKKCQNSIENFKVKTRINAGLAQFHKCLNEEMVADLRYFNSLELEVDYLRSQLETQKTQFLNEIDRISREYYYADHMNAILELSKSKMMLKTFESVQKHAINLELELQQCKEKIKNEKLFKTKDFCKEHKQYFKIQDLKAQLQDKGIVISELKKLIEKLKGKSVDTKFEKSSVIRQPNAFKSQRPSILGKTTTFSNSFERRDFSKSTSVTQNNVSNDFSKPVTVQTLPPNKKSILKNTNVLAPGMYKLHTESNQTRTSQLPQDSRKTNKRVSFSTRVIPTTSVSRLQLKSNSMGDRVMHNNSQGKKQEVEDQRRSVKLPKNKTFVTACTDSLNAKTSNVNSVCATCDTYVLNDKHDMCVLNSVAKPIKKTVASESNQKPRNLTRKLYECVKIVLFIVDSGCSKHMMGNLKLLINFVEKFLGTVTFGNDQIAPILRYRDLVQGAVTIKRVYYVEGLNHNLFFVGQLCDADLKVAFRKSTCYIRDLKGNDLLTGSRGTDLYSITLQDTNYPNPICLMAKASSSQAWLWHRRLSHLNFDTINLLSKNDIVVGLSKLKFVKDHLCSSCELGKAKRKSFHTKITPSSKRRLQLLHMDLCGPMRVASINGKIYVLVIVDDYSRYTWTHFLRSKDETPKVLINFLRLVQRGLQA
nr:retrovirus-related Pol polyprotein from transposon TNT 1-94 [Tanacetum cinerariifolium]